jgi:hypothetical protein
MKIDFWRFCGACAAMIGAAACDSVTERGELHPIPARYDIVSGNQQTAAPRSELPNPLVVRAVDANGQPVPSQIINFRVTQGGGSVFAGVAVTDAQGLAHEYWTVGPTPGSTQTVEARAVDAASGAKLVFATFTATVTDPATVVATVAVSPGSASLVVGATQQLTATASNANGVALSGKTFTWSSSNTSVATVNGSGLVTARGRGTVAISATSEGKSGASTITVTKKGGRK